MPSPNAVFLYQQFWSEDQQPWGDPETFIYGGDPDSENWYWKYYWAYCWLPYWCDDMHADQYLQYGPGWFVSGEIGIGSTGGTPDSPVGYWRMLHDDTFYAIVWDGLQGPRHEESNPDKEQRVGEPINTINGAMDHMANDLQVECPGLPLSFARYYNTRIGGTSGPLGPQWSHTYLWSLAATNTVEYGQANAYHVMRMGDGEQLWFLEYTNNTYSTPFGSLWRLSRLTNGQHEARAPDGASYLFDTNGLLVRIGRDFGNAVTLAYSNQLLTSVTHTNGLALQFSYQSNRLVTVTTPSTNLGVSFAYSASGQLTNAAVTAGADVYRSTYSYQNNPTQTVQCMTQRLDAAGWHFAHSYATNAAGPSVPDATNVVVESQYYVCSLDYGTSNDHQTVVSYNRGDTNLVFTYHLNDALQRVERITGPGGTNYETRFVLDALGNRLETIVTNTLLAEASRLVMQRDEFHNVTDMAYGLCSLPSNSWSFTWETNYMALTSVTDPEGHKTGIEYTNSLPCRFRTYFDATNSYDTLLGYTTNGLVCGITNANGHWIRCEYDGYGRLSRVAPQTGPSISCSNNVLGHLMRITLPGDDGNREVVFSPNARGWVTNVLFPDGQSERFQYDGLGNLTNLVDRLGHETRLSFLPTRKLSAVNRIGNGVTNLLARLEYDQQFNTLKVVDGLGRAAESYVLDGLDRPVTVTNLDGQVMAVNYGVEQYVRSVTRFDGTTVSNRFDSDGRLWQGLYPDSTNTFTYLRNNLLRTASNEQGTVSNAYDFANRLTAAAGVAPSGTVSYSYFPAGNVSNISSVAGTVTNTYDEAERVASIRHPGFGCFQYVYSTNSGLIASVTCTNTGLAVSYAFDVMDRVTNIVWRNAASQVLRGFAYAYDNAGMITNRQITGSGQSVANTYTYDALDRLTGEVRMTGTATGTTSLAYDDVGNRTNKAVGGALVTYTYSNGCNRLTGWTASSTNAFQTLAQLDVLGGSSEAVVTNPWLGQLWVSGAVQRAASAGSTNFWASGVPVGAGTQILVAAVADLAGNVGYATNSVVVTVVTNGAYQYNAAGCVTGITYRGAEYTNVIGLSWNGQYQITTIRTNGTVAESYQFDALGRRACTADSTSTNWHVYDGAQVIADVNATGGLIRSYLWGPGIDNLLAMTVHTGATVKTYYALTDHQGTVHALADTNGAIVESYEFDAWGRVLGVYGASGLPIANLQSSIGNRYLWQGREYSWKTGLYYFRARWYDPVTGRWLSNDPIGISGGLNQYVFCGNNPVNLRDPYGLFWKEMGQGIKNAGSWVIGNKPGDIFTIGLGGGVIIPAGPVPIPFGGGFSFDRVVMASGQADWFFTFGLGLSSPGVDFAADRGRTDAECKDQYKGPSVSINVDLAPIGFEAGAPGWNPSGWADKLFFGKGGLHVGEGINLLWNWTWDIGK